MEWRYPWAGARFRLVSEEDPPGILDAGLDPLRVRWASP